MYRYHSLNSMEHILGVSRNTIRKKLVSLKQPIRKIKQRY
jgi:biotin operon repressor